MAPFSSIEEATRFRPTNETAADVLAAFIDPHLSLAGIAAQYQTTPIALAEWLDTPEITERLDALQRVTARRAHLIAVGNERLALGVLLSILEAHRDDELNLPVNNQSLKAVVQRDRRRATARLAASQLLRLAGPGGTGVPPVVHQRQPLAHKSPGQPANTSGETGYIGSARSNSENAKTKSHKSKNKHKLTRAASPLPFQTSRDRHTLGGLLPRGLLNACGGSISSAPLFGRPIGAWIDGAA